MNPTNSILSSPGGGLVFHCQSNGGKGNITDPMNLKVLDMRSHKTPEPCISFQIPDAPYTQVACVYTNKPVRVWLHNSGNSFEKPVGDWIPKMLVNGTESNPL